LHGVTSATSGASVAAASWRSEFAQADPPDCSRFAVPKDTPAEIVATLNREINAVLADPSLRARLIALGAEPLVMSVADAAKFVADETAKWGKVIRDAGLKAE